MLSTLISLLLFEFGVTQEVKPRIHGVASGASRARGISIVGGRERTMVTAWLADFRGCRSLLCADADTGSYQEYTFDTPTKRSVPYAHLISSSLKIYSMFGERFIEFDPLARTIETKRILGEQGAAMAMTEGNDGRIWAATFPDGLLYSFDPSTKTVSPPFSILSASWPLYPRSLVAQGKWLYVGYGFKESRLYGVHIPSGTIKDYTNTLPGTEAIPGQAARVEETQDGDVQANWKKEGPFFRLHKGRITETPRRKRAVAYSGSQDTVLSRGIDVTKRDIYLDVPRKVLRVNDGIEHKYPINYCSSGARIFSLGTRINSNNQEATVFGSTGHPLALFSFSRGSFKRMYPAKVAGHFNCIVSSESGRIYGALYGKGGLLFDLTESFLRGREPKPLLSKVRQLGRPLEMIEHPESQELIIAGTPGYGFTEGVLVIYSPEAGGTSQQIEVLPRQNVMAMTILPNGNLLGGTTSLPGTGGTNADPGAQLFLLDWNTKKVVLRKRFSAGEARDIRDLITGTAGEVYGIASGPTIFAIDDRLEILRQRDLRGFGTDAGGQAPEVLLLGPDGFLYVLLKETILRVDPQSLEVIDSVATHAEQGLTWCDSAIYFSDGATLKSVEASTLGWPKR